jgi:HK97 family phage major capsid protein
MNLKDMTTEALLERRSAIATELDAEGADLDALEAEVRGINAELEARKAAEAKRAELRSMVGQGAGKKIETKELRGAAPKTEAEIRSSKAYIDAYANYIKTEDATECRALLTTLATGGQVPVPTILEGRIRTAWERSELLSRVTRSYARGVMRVGFELSATDAAIHEEGDDAPDEEVLTFGVVTLTPKSIKKWITISDEAADMGGEEFLDYIFDEIEYKLTREAQKNILAAIIAAPAAATATAVGVPAITGTPTLGIVAEAIGKLSDEATRPVIVMNKSTWAAFKAVQYAGQFNVDPFEGLTVIFDNTLKTPTAAASGETWMIVGDPAAVQVNFPNGDDVRIKYDDTSLAEKDLIKIVGRMYAAIGVTTDKALVKVTKA